MIKSAVCFGAWAGFLIIIWSHFCFGSDQKNHVEWWVNTYGALTEKDHPLAPEVLRVFERVREVADKRSNRYPKGLVIIRKSGNPWALCLPDGYIILTPKAMDICYSGVDKQTGSSRMAFVIGHELAHLSNDNFWHFSAFQAIQNFSENDKGASELKDLLQKSDDFGNTPHAKEIKKNKELQADHYGLLYVSMAGFDPLAVVNTNGKNFFREWSDQITAETAYTDERYPTPDLRSAFLLSEMKAVADDLELFHLGVRLYQTGKYKDGLAFLEAFEKKYPGREVSNNIGLIHYQIAVSILSECDPEEAFRYKLATTVDTETRAKLFFRGSGKGRDLLPAFKTRIREAIRHFEIACEKDSSYVPARVNLSSALILSSKYSEALAAADEALSIQKDDVNAMNNRAIAVYQLGQSIQVDMVEAAVSILHEIVKKDPSNSHAYYNLSQIMAERQRSASAIEYSKKFLNIEISGAYASNIKKRLKHTETTPLPKPLKPPFNELQPVKLGDVDETSAKELEKYEKHSFAFGVMTGEYYINQGIRVLVLEGVIELVESPVNHTVTLSDLTSEYGGANMKHNAPSGITTLVYDHFAVDVLDDLIIKIVWFEKKVSFPLS